MVSVLLLEDVSKLLGLEYEGSLWWSWVLEQLLGGLSLIIGLLVFGGFLSLLGLVGLSLTLAILLLMQLATIGIVAPFLLVNLRLLLLLGSISIVLFGDLKELLLLLAFSCVLSIILLGGMLLS